VENPGMDKLNAEITKYSGALLKIINCPTYSKCGVTKEAQYKTYTKLTVITTSRS